MASDKCLPILDPGCAGCVAFVLFYMNEFLISPLISIILNCLQDLLRCRILTRGIIETRFQVDRVNFQ